MSKLKILLTKFYKKKGNQIIFSNGLNLNQLSMLMWEKLNFEGMDASVLSKIVNGKRLFTQKQLNVFSNILNLTFIDHSELNEALGNEILTKHFGLTLPPNKYDELVADRYTSNYVVNKIRQLKNEGNIKEALEMSSFFQKILTIDSKVLKNNSLFVAKILNEKAKCIIFIEKPSKILNRISNLTKIALEIGHETNDLDILSMVHGNIGGSLYVAKKWKESAEYLEKTIDLVTIELKIEYIRTLLNNYAFLKEKKLYNKTLDRAFKILSESEKYNESHIASIYEAMARSQALMGNFKKSKEIINSCSSKEIIPFYQSQILRGKMFTNYQEFKTKGKINLDEVKTIYLESQKDEYKVFTRHKNQIINMYKNMSNE